MYMGKPSYQLANSTHTFLQIFTVPIYLKSKHNISFSDGLCLYDPKVLL